MHRVMGAVLIACALIAPAARAQDDEGGQVIAREGDNLFRVKSDGRRICLTVNEYFPECERRPATPFETVWADRGTPPSGPLGAALSPEVAAVSLQRPGGESRRFATLTVAGSDLRFLFVARPGRVLYLRTYGADGRALGIATPEFGADQPAGRFTRGRLVVQRLVEPDPDPVSITRTLTYVCATARQANALVDPCATGDRQRPLDVALGETCAPRRPVLVGLAAGDVRRVTARLTDGRIRSARTIALPDAFGDRRAVSIPLPRRVGVRTATARTDGRRVRVGVRVGPTGYGCDGGIGLAFGVSLRERDPHADTLTTVAPQLALGDDNRDLCLKIGDGRQQCYPPPVDFENILAFRTGARVATVVPPVAASVAIRRPDGSAVALQPVATDAYTGRYAGRVAVFAGRVPRPGLRADVVVRDAAGHRLNEDGIVIPEVRRTVGRHRRGPVPGTPLRADSYRRSGTFLSLPGGFDQSAGDGAFSWSVSCRPARTTIYGGGPPVPLRLAGGGTLQPTAFRIPRRLGGGRGWIATPTTEVVAAGGEPLHLPAATDQCGYGGYGS